jgi:hypothetical protein
MEDGGGSGGLVTGIFANLNTGLESPVNRQAGKPALHRGQAAPAPLAGSRQERQAFEDEDENENEEDSEFEKRPMKSDAGRASKKLNQIKPGKTAASAE